MAIKDNQKEKQARG